MAWPRDLRIDARRVLPARLFRLRFSRSGGPGGQNVNKVASKVDLRLDINAAAEILGADVIRRLRARFANRLDRDGHLYVTSNEHREQAQNIEAALSRVLAMIRQVLHPPRPRRPTKPTRASKERRLDAKKRRGQVKKSRSRVRDD